MSFEEVVLLFSISSLHEQAVKFVVLTPNYQMYLLPYLLSLNRVYLYKHTLKFLYVFMPVNCCLIVVTLRWYSIFWNKSYLFVDFNNMSFLWTYLYCCCCFFFSFLFCLIRQFILNSFVFLLPQVRIVCICFYHDIEKVNHIEKKQKFKIYSSISYSRFISDPPFLGVVF